MDQKMQRKTLYMKYDLICAESMLLCSLHFGELLTDLATIKSTTPSSDIISLLNSGIISLLLL